MEAETQTSEEGMLPAEGRHKETPHWFQQLIKETAAPQRRGITGLITQRNCKKIVHRKDKSPFSSLSVSSIHSAEPNREPACKANVVAES